MRLPHICCTVFLLTVMSTGPANGQVHLPAEVSSLPSWPGEEAAAKLQPQRYVFRDANGQIVVSYAVPEKPGHRVLYRFWLPNRVEPQVVASVARSEAREDAGFVYRYKMRNAASAAVPIVQWYVVAPANDEAAPVHPEWTHYNAKSPVAPQALLPGDPNGTYVVWRADKVPGLSPGQELEGFSLNSRFLPGLTTGYASGDGILEEPDGEFPEPVVEVLVRLQRPHVWKKPFITVGPRFVPGTSRTEIFGAFRKDVGSLIDRGLLSLASPYIQELNDVLNRQGDSPVDNLAMKTRPLSPVEQDIDRAFRISVAAAR